MSIERMFGGETMKGRNKTKKQSSKKNVSSGSLDDADSLSAGASQSTANASWSNSGGSNSNSFFGRLQKATTRRPSMEMKSQETNNNANSKTKTRKSFTRRPSQTGFIDTTSPATTNSGDPSSEIFIDRRPSSGRRPSLGGSFTTRRPNRERRPSMDTASTTQYLADHNNCVGTSYHSARSLVAQRHPSMASVTKSDDGGGGSCSNLHSTAAPTQTILYQTTGTGGAGVATTNTSGTAAPINCPKVHPVVEAMLAALSGDKKYLLDVEISGRDGVSVMASRFILACRIEALEEKLYPKGDDPLPALVEIDNDCASTAALEALVEYCFAGDCPILKKQETPENARAIVELAELAWSLNFRILVDETYQWARRMMNRTPYLACVFYDAAASVCVKEFETYALQTIEDSPKEAFVGEEVGIRHLSAARLETILDGHEMEMEEMSIFWMVSRWVDNRSDENTMAAARRCAKNIKLVYIEPTALHTVIKNSGFFDDADIEKAIAEQGQMASRSVSSGGRGSVGMDDDTLERVLVQGAGAEEVNGIFLRQVDRDGEAMYSKGEGTSSIGLFKWETTWGIGPSFDLSNMFYECSVNPDAPNRVPSHGWQISLQGEMPPPNCTWVAGDLEHTEDVIGGRSESKLPAAYQNEEELYGN